MDGIVTLEPLPSSAIMGSEHAQLGSVAYRGHALHDAMGHSAVYGSAFVGGHRPAMLSAKMTPIAPTRCALSTFIVKVQPTPPRSSNMMNGEGKPDGGSAVTLHPSGASFG